MCLLWVGGVGMQAEKGWWKDLDPGNPRESLTLLTYPLENPLQWERMLSLHQRPFLESNPIDPHLLQLIHSSTLRIP